MQANRTTALVSITLCEINLSKYVYFDIRQKCYYMTTFANIKTCRCLCK